VTKRPQVRVCGGRSNAFKQFLKAHRLGDAEVWLLVDAEENASIGPPFDPWGHVKRRIGDGWDRPSDAVDDQLHLMSVCMETWLLADRAALREVLGSKLKLSKLPPEGAELEAKQKCDVYAALEAASKPTPSGNYGKGAHSFKVLELVDPKKLRALPWANRFLSAMEGSH